MVRKEGYSNEKFNDNCKNLINGWMTIKLKDIIKYTKGYAFKSRDYTKNGIRIIRVSDTTFDSIKDDNIVCINENESAKYDNWRLKKDDIIVSTVGSKPPMYDSLVGKAILINSKYEGSLLNQNAVIFRSDKVNQRLIYANLKNEKYINYIEKIFRGNANQASITINELLEYEFTVPINTKEQESISTVLTDMDNIISSIDKLIYKKKLIKEATMEELLTGKKRLPGFSMEWSEEFLKDLCWFQEGPGLRNWQFTSNGMKVINITNLENGYLNLSKTDRHISIKEFDRMYKHFEIDEGDIVMASSGNSYGKVSVVRGKDLPLMMNTSVIRFKPSYKIEYKFLLQFLKSKLFISQIDLLITGGAQPNFGPAHLNKITINLPHTKEEQEAIATILHDMDDEIEKLEKKLEKYKNIKNSMMEELLTGKRRLV